MDSSLNGALKRAKRKQILRISIISFIVLIILLPILFITGNYFTAKRSTSIHEALFLHNAILEPNIRIDSQVTSNSSMFGGNIVSNRSKNINGYLVPWNTLISSYDWLRTGIDSNELVPGFYWSRSNKEFYEFDKQTKSIVATFFHPSIKEYFIDIPNEISELLQMEDYVAEVAISFDQPYKFQEIQAKIPDNLNVVWLYMTSPIADESKGPAGVPVYGFNPGDVPKESYKTFINDLEMYDDTGDNVTIQAFLQTNKKKQFEDVEILGVMLTGQTKNFKTLENQDFIRGASVGSTVQMVPYIKPEK